MSIPSAGVYKLDQAHKRVGFLARHMMVSPVRGEFREANAQIVVGEDPLASSVTAIINTGSLTTHNADRDTHLRGPDFLDVERFPLMRYRSTGMSWKGADDPIFLWARLRNNKLNRRVTGPEPTPGPVRFTLHGQLTVRDVTRSVDLRVEWGGARRDPYGQDIFGFSASAEIEREDYGLLWNVALESGGVLVGKTVHIEIAGEALRAD
ncbi:polyisoprenoid-binding protein [Asanoa ishikariensis]|uniref:Polyisoprenoid-binding protein YceI n=1 Tax=Asanoa ishikariensis TaxID=137265 RepID=A0A1H3RJ29_9ACTN|nr:YceI family protein [Asanoa ishikariensis]GIF67166.1 polyisoprenoid-binding protein [Asanoa ishikariensis]SDZ25666.1 Polyisoprenoid-binding protein YceI [Asanoa ishikariensis]